MLFRWNLYLLFLVCWLLSFHVAFLAGEHPRGPSSRPFDSDLVESTLGRSSSPSVSWEDSWQGVLGEYSDVEEVSETAPSYRRDEEPASSSKASSTNGFMLLTPPTGQPPPDLTSDTENSTPLVATSRPGWTFTFSEDVVPIRGAPTTETEKDGSQGADDDQQLQKSSGPLQTSVTPCGTTIPTWTPMYQDEFPPSHSLSPSLDYSPSLFVPLYSDWNTALATWGFAWEAHVYGLGSVFTVFGLISVVCLLGLPFRCPSGSPYFTLLHLFLIGFTGIQAFCLLYDAYRHQDRLPTLSSLLLSQLPFPCLISAFSLAFFLLSLRSRKRLSLSLAISPSLSALPKPCLLLSLSLVHFGVSLGCVGVLQLFHSLPSIILLLPQGLFVCLTLILSCSYVIFYCLIKVDTRHIYRLNDNGEGGGSPEMMQPASCPFAKVEDWGRAAGAGIGASLCLLGCGGLQLYGILHALGLGGVERDGFLPWPWWGYQIGCRLCEAGVCLGLSLIGTHPLFCHTKSFKAHPRPGSWSRLSCSSPSRGITLPTPGRANSTIISWSQDKPEEMVVCGVTTKGQSEVLPLGLMVDRPGKELAFISLPNQSHTALLTTPTSPAHKPKNVDFQLSSLSLGADSTVDLRPPSPIDLSRSIDQALYSESLFAHSIFGLPRLFPSSSSHSLGSPKQGTSKQGPASEESSLYRTSSCGDLDQEDNSKPSQPHGILKSQNKAPVSSEQSDWKGSVSGSTLGLCSKPKETRKLRSNSWANRGQNMAQNSLPRAIPHLSYRRRYRTLSVASKDGPGFGQLAGTKHLSESKQLEWDLAVQAEFVNVCRQIDALSICSDTIEL
ncbi:proline-rich transmembrane protein 4 [Phycodurus eques]|uniref:proline-rich transmembrane protein 4 n=1 Tax=Phycodurus eques TaxID=693459 RepID=UPI002ACE7D1D|nr:proline-rich transmembrane protein 4 [Phycodurus eques]